MSIFSKLSVTPFIITMTTGLWQVVSEIYIEEQRLIRTAESSPERIK